ncbi:hypothetical protein [Ornithinibacillus halophilus]|uniref:Cytochrome c oxidase subunit IIa family protein n=1 Tax=Ornithinibacillus halophilus TaxID=930117 RepID=A0A1M5I1E7_9BACI|nr:hypothetical protein [Ornithinibacillus halophilus]SHG21982.1 hypothetical protein SAMN05216225_10211 [Ornithinibacillus halophilus]
MENKKVNREEEQVEEHSAKGALASSLIFVGGFIFALYIAIYWLFMVRIDL